MPASSHHDVLIDRQPQLDDACAALRAGEAIGIDTEFLRTSQYAPVLCIVQVAAGGRVFCVDELAGLDSTPLWDVLCAGAGLRIVHAAKQDQEVIRIRHGRLLSPLFDTQVAAALAGHPPQVGYAGLVKALMDIDIDKTHTRADWSKRPLAPELIDYAATDVAHLHELHDRLADTLRRLGRYEWALEDSARLTDPALYAVDVDEAWRRMPGIPRMAPRAQLRARRLARWREEYAMRSDKPRQWILSDRALLDIAQRGPANAAGLAECEDVQPGFVRRQGEAVLAELAAADDDFAAGVVPVQEPRAELVDPAELKRLGRVVEACARELDIPQEILATRRDLTGLIRGERDLRPLAGWRRAVIGERLLAAVAG